MSERKTARSVLAYERGARIANRMAMISVLIGLIAIVIGGGVVYMANKARNQALADVEIANGLVTAANEKAKEVGARTEAITAFNFELISLTTLAADVKPGADRIASNAAEKAETLIAQAAEDEELKAMVPKLMEIRKGIFVAYGDLAAAIDAQRQLVSGFPTGARIIDLAILQCSAGDFAAAEATLRNDKLTAADAALITEGLRFQPACGTRFDALAATLAPAAEGPPPGAPAEQVLEEATGDILKDVGTTTPSRGPASVPELDDVLPPPQSKITKVFLHVRDETQRASAVAIAAQICKPADASVQAYDMPGVQVVAAPKAYPPNARVIYYYVDQAPAAESIASQVQSIASGLGLRGYDAPFESRIYSAEGLPEDRVEIWFAAGAPGSDETVPKQSKCSAGGDLR
jgi:hypothetical protein